MTAPGTEWARGTSLPAVTIVAGGEGLGVIGTSPKGPAFVPMSLKDLNGFIAKYGTISGDSFGMLAADAWLANSEGCTFMRLLGIGDGLKRLITDSSNSDGESIAPGAVKNAGFIVGAEMTGSNGFLGANPYAVSGGPPGRTYFLGAFMSESAGSTYFSDAGIQGTGTSGVASTAEIEVTDAGAIAGGETMAIVDSTGASTTFTFNGAPNWNANVASSGGTATVGIGSAGGGATGKLRVAFAIADTISKITDRDYTASTDGVDTVTVTQSTEGFAGNKTNTDAVTGVTVGNFSGGGDPPNYSRPILRGVLFAASGVIPALSGCYTGNTSTASLGPAAGNFLGSNDGGASIGSIYKDDASDKFVLLLNGHIPTAKYPNEINASLNVTTADDTGNIYFGNVFNTNPNKIREAGHYLYTYYDVYQSQAKVDGTGFVDPSKAKIDTAGATLHDAIFLTTSSMDRNPNDAAGSLAIPNFENFCDRYQTAKTPVIFSQLIDRRQFDLFRFHSLNDGTNIGSEIKITIENLKPQAADDLYGSFDVVIRDLADLDDAITPITPQESFLGCNLDPSSDFYIAKKIGDRHFYFNFDTDKTRQKYVRTGDYENASAYVRVEVNPAVRNQILPTKILPAGFRGPYHLVTSGSNILSNNQHPLSDGSVVQSSTSWAHKIVQPPMPYRIQLSNDDDTGSVSPSEKSIDSNTKYWGIKTTKQGSIERPNLLTDQNTSFVSYLKYFPTFMKNRINPWVGDNNGIDDSAGTIYDADRFNNAKFSLENILIHTTSKAIDIADTEQWAYARYRPDRTKIPLIDKTLNSRAGVRFFDFSKDLSVDTPNIHVGFTVPMQGGFDGLDMFSVEKSNFSNLASYFEMQDENQGHKTGATTAAYLTALRILEEKSEVAIKLLALPGIRIEAITNKALQVAEERFDAFYVMDIEEVASGSGLIVTGSEEIDVTLTAERFRSRMLDSSFAAVYFPDIQMLNPSVSSSLIFTPPSISAIRVYSRLSSQGIVSAPAGTKRGIIDTNDEGLAIQAKVLFDDTQKETITTLYDAVINPIISYPDVGLILFGQRTTFNSADSMLQRVAVRRMVLEIRRLVREVAKGFLFEQNKESTLKYFERSVSPLIQRMVNAGGISKFKVKIDTSTTSQVDIENNVVRGMVFLQPTKSDEIIQVDFST